VDLIVLLPFCVLFRAHHACYDALMASGTVLPLVFSERKHPVHSARRALRESIKAQKAACCGGGEALRASSAI
jgi:hypothetical protein